MLFVGLLLFYVCGYFMCQYPVLSFFFQAEDGIRDLVRSRGLGDVYKRQRQSRGIAGRVARLPQPARTHGADAGRVRCERSGAVSYTHLTLPTSDLV